MNQKERRAGLSRDCSPGHDRNRPEGSADRSAYSRSMAESADGSRLIVSDGVALMLPGAQPRTSSKLRATVGVGRPPRSTSKVLMVASLSHVRRASSRSEIPSASRNSMRALASRADSSLMTAVCRRARAGTAF